MRSVGVEAEVEPITDYTRRKKRGSVTYSADFTFTTEESEKLEVQRIAGGPEGSLEGAIRRLAEKKREEQKQVSNPK